MEKTQIYTNGHARAVAETYATLAGKAYGSALRAVILFGSVSRGEYEYGKSDIDVALILDKVGAEPEVCKRYRNSFDTHIFPFEVSTRRWFNEKNSDHILREINENGEVLYAA